ncbi:hypothetical protein EV191_11524 [Tamaricihabitans halophyticus]|uniref:OB-fold protein n=1 Tax=Tamaricihabitans halophyticus TaxID=1262583 RepID=A0A4R2QBQ2_9PSEU|nr:OB-fold domain-containing protein [Tamaricihabitans halophyticus]TCP45744.1 hypothetical protein EV191_11524 [Tamaricihabitans halophyticus]
MSHQSTAVPPLIITEDNRFWFAAAEQGWLAIQRCTRCHTLRHPPAPCCARCQSFEWDTIESSRRANLCSYTVIHHPRDTAFDYPLVVGLVDLPEGIRLVADIVGIEPDELVAGMELDVTFAEHAHGAVLPRLTRPEVWR